MAGVQLPSDEIAKLIKYEPATGRLLRIAQRYRGGRLIPYAKPREAGSIGANGYVELHVGGEHVYGHRLAWFLTHGEWPEQDIDHINGDRSDNRIANLRPATRSQNVQNRRVAGSNNKLGLLGVRFDPRVRRYTAQIGLTGRSHYLGNFATPEEAHQAYLDAKRDMHEFAVA